MRRGRDCGIVIHEGVFVGFCLGADYCAEHEWGIKGIRREYGIDPEKDGFEGRKITQLPEHFKYDDKKNMISSTRYGSLGELIPLERLKDWGEDMSGAWDEGTFAVVVVDEYKEQLKELAEAFKRHDIVVTIGGRQAFANGGLNLLIYSRIPKEVKDDAVKESRKHNELLKAVKKTGIEETLKKAGKRYFALSPKWKDYEKKEIMYWLNPMEQDIHNYGWYTLEDLKLWAKNKGPIPKEK